MFLAGGDARRPAAAALPTAGGRRAQAAAARPGSSPCAARVAVRAAARPGAALPAAAALLAAAGCVGEPHCPAGPPPGDGPAELRLLSYNIGNNDDDVPGYRFRLSHQRYEDHVGARLRALAPDVVALQEVLPRPSCGAVDERRPDRTCYRYDERPAQVRRLLGDAYEIACAGAFDLECVGVRRAFGRILGPIEETELPMGACAHDDCAEEGHRCDAEASVSALRVEGPFGPFRVVHIHASAIGSRCRQREALQAFDLAGDGPTVIVGDWNFDPELGRYVLESAIWSEHVGPTRRFRDHSVRDADCRALRTSIHHPIAIDRAVSDFLVGSCRPLLRPRLDSGFDFPLRSEARIDHYALYCELRREAP